jgi:hypothetical protein
MKQNFLKDRFTSFLHPKIIHLLYKGSDKFQIYSQEFHMY